MHEEKGKLNKMLAVIIKFKTKQTKLVSTIQAQKLEHNFIFIILASNLMFALPQTFAKTFSTEEDSSSSSTQSGNDNAISAFTQSYQTSGNLELEQTSATTIQNQLVNKKQISCYTCSTISNPECRFFNGYTDSQIGSTAIGYGKHRSSQQMLQSGADLESGSGYRLNELLYSQVSATASQQLQEHYNQSSNQSNQLASQLLANQHLQQPQSKAYLSTSVHSRACQQDELFCSIVSIVRLDTNSSKIITRFWALERNCSKSCNNGCLFLGEKIRLKVCSHCCLYPNCNIGNSARSHYLGISLFAEYLLLIVMFAVQLEAILCIYQ